MLKGAALAHLVYPQPGLRPMRDVDVLVSRSQADQAQTLLAELGFTVTGAKLPPDHKHLPVTQRKGEGLPVSVEVHHNLYSRGTAATELAALRLAATPFTLAGIRAYTLSYEDLLEHIYLHMVEDGIFSSWRLIWIADLVSLAERFAAEIDWSRVNPRVRNALALCHWLTPLSADLLRAAALTPGRPPSGLGQEFQGWPRFSLAAQCHKGYGRILRDSFFPAEWWLRFYYGLPAAPSTKLRPDPVFWWRRWLRHPLHILGWVGRYFVDRAKHS